MTPPCSGHSSKTNNEIGHTYRCPLYGRYIVTGSQLIVEVIDKQERYKQTLVVDCLKKTWILCRALGHKKDRAKPRQVSIFDVMSSFDI